jgi:arsenate reductase-like glutaredoxin family protein
MAEGYYRIHVRPDCPWCQRAKALLEHYGIEYKISSEQCEEWPTVPAIYKVSPSDTELIGGYNELCTLSFEGRL